MVSEVSADIKTISFVSDQRNFHFCTIACYMASVQLSAVFKIASFVKDHDCCVLEHIFIRVDRTSQYIFPICLYGDFSRIRCRNGNATCHESTESQNLTPYSSFSFHLSISKNISPSVVSIGMSGSVVPGRVICMS